MTNTMPMTSTQRRLVFGATAIVGLSFIALSVYLGLEKADKAASIASAIFGFVSVAIASYQLITQRGDSADTSRQTQHAGDGSINIMGGNDVHIGDNNTFGKP